jgi:hypothetical protein
MKTSPAEALALSPDLTCTAPVDDAEDEPLSIKAPPLATSIDEVVPIEALMDPTISTAPPDTPTPEEIDTDPAVEPEPASRFIEPASSRAEPAIRLISPDEFVDDDPVAITTDPEAPC